jgi:hypothetical protein
VKDSNEHVACLDQVNQDGTKNLQQRLYHEAITDAGARNSGGETIDPILWQRSALKDHTRGSSQLVRITVLTIPHHAVLSVEDNKTEYQRCKDVHKRHPIYRIRKT